MITLSNYDKNLCKIAYDEAFCAIQELPAWNLITVVGEALPAMAVFVIKYDEIKNPRESNVE